MSTTNWQQYDFENRVRAILKKIVAEAANHHLGTPFLTAYQLAIEFDKLHPGVTGKLGLQVGGKGIGEHVSLAQYMAAELSRRIQREEIADIEGAFLSRLHVESLLFSPEVESSTENLSMFRFRPEAVKAATAT